MYLTYFSVIINIYMYFFSRNYELRKVMVNGDVPPKVKKDAHALILEFIRSRPPLKKVYIPNNKPVLCVV